MSSPHLSLAYISDYLRRRIAGGHTEHRYIFPAAADALDRLAAIEERIKAAGKGDSQKGLDTISDDLLRFGKTLTFGSPEWKAINAAANFMRAHHRIVIHYEDKIAAMEARSEADALPL